MTRSSKDSTDVTLVFDDDMIPKGHKVVLSSAGANINNFGNVHGVELPAGWKMKEHPAGWKMKEQLKPCYDWVESEGKKKTLPQYLNAGKIVKTMRDDAILPPYTTVLQLHQGSFNGTIKFSTGMY